MAKKNITKKTATHKANCTVCHAGKSVKIIITDKGDHVTVDIKQCKKCHYQHGLKQLINQKI